MISLLSIAQLLSFPMLTVSVIASFWLSLRVNGLRGALRKPIDFDPTLAAPFDRLLHRISKGGLIGFMCCFALILGIGFAT